MRISNRQMLNNLIYHISNKNTNNVCLHNMPLLIRKKPEDAQQLWSHKNLVDGLFSFSPLSVYEHTQALFLLL